MKTELTVTVRLRIGVGTIKKVKAHKRVVNGKTVKVRSHYRRILGAE